MCTAKVDVGPSVRKGHNVKVEIVLLVVDLHLCSSFFNLHRHVQIVGTGVGFVFSAELHLGGVVVAKSIRAGRSGKV